MLPSGTRTKLSAISGYTRPSGARLRGANQGSVDITRDINGKVITGRVRTSDPLLPGDTVYVRERLF